MCVCVCVCVVFLHPLSLSLTYLFPIYVLVVSEIVYLCVELKKFRIEPTFSFGLVELPLGNGTPCLEKNPGKVSKSIKIQDCANYLTKQNRQNRNLYIVS